MSKPLIAIVGATASGKSSLALKLAESFNGEIVSADSWVVRSSVDIGSAKPTTAELGRIKHHLIDIIKPDQDFSAALYKQLSLNAIETIHKKGKLPFLVGGTGLYIDAVLYDYSFLPSAGINIRKELNNKTLNELHGIAKSRNLSLEAIDRQNKRRVIRLIETNGSIATRRELRDNCLIIGIKTTKEQLNENIKIRVKEMITKGLEKEVASLYLKYGWDCEALKGIGYQEWKLYFEGIQSMEQTEARIIKDTQMLAKRQDTWFKRNKSIHWIDNPSNFSKVEEIITTFLNKNIFL